MKILQISDINIAFFVLYHIYYSHLNYKTIKMSTVTSNPYLILDAQHTAGLIAIEAALVPGMTFAQLDTEIYNLFCHSERGCHQQSEESGV